MAKDDQLTDKIVSASKKVHQELGPGFVERIYHCALKVAMDDANLDFDSEKDFSVFYQDQRVGSFKCDFFVESKVVVFIKAQTEKLSADTELQTNSQFKASKAAVGLLLNFGGKEMEVKQLA